MARINGIGWSRRHKGAQNDNDRHGCGPHGVHAVSPSRPPKSQRTQGAKHECAQQPRNSAEPGNTEPRAEVQERRVRESERAHSPREAAPRNTCTHEFHDRPQARDTHAAREANAAADEYEPSERTKYGDVESLKGGEGEPRRESRINIGPGKKRDECAHAEGEARNYSRDPAARERCKNKPAESNGKQPPEPVRIKRQVEQKPADDGTEERDNRLCKFFSLEMRDEDLTNVVGRRGFILHNGLLAPAKRRGGGVEWTRKSPPHAFVEPTFLAFTDHSTHTVSPNSTFTYPGPRSRAKAEGGPSALSPQRTRGTARGHEQDDREDR